VSSSHRLLGESLPPLHEAELLVVLQEGVHPPDQPPLLRGVVGDPWPIEEEPIHHGQVVGVPQGDPFIN